MTTDLDTRLERAVSSLHRSVDSVPVGKPRPPANPLVRVGVAFLVAGALLAGVLVLRPSRDINVKAAPAAEVSALVADTAAAGLEVAWAGEQSGAASVNADVAGERANVQPVALDTYIYGDAEADLPFSASDLVVNVWEAGDIDAAAVVDEAAAAAGQVVTVRGVEAVVGTDANGAATLHWLEAPAGVEVAVASRTLSVDQLIAVVEGLTITTDLVELAAVPEGVAGPLAEVAQLSGAAVAGARDTVAQWVGYTNPAVAGSVLDITTLAGDHAQLMALVWELGAATQTTVRDHAAWVSTDAATGTVELVWEEASGVLASVAARGLSEAAVLALVEELHGASDGDWAEIEAAAAAVVESGGAGADANAGAAETDANAQANAGAGGVDANVDAGGAGNVDAHSGAGGVDANVDAGDTNVDANVSTQGGLDAELRADLGGAAVIDTGASVGPGGIDAGAAVEGGDSGDSGLLDP